MEVPKPRSGGGPGSGTYYSITPLHHASLANSSLINWNIFSSVLRLFFSHTGNNKHNEKAMPLLENRAVREAMLPRPPRHRTWMETLSVWRMQGLTSMVSRSVILSTPPLSSYPIFHAMLF
jgi:hypothetical protein